MSPPSDQVPNAVSARRLLHIPNSADLCVFLPLGTLGFENAHSNDGNNGFSLDSALNNLNGMTNASAAGNMMMGSQAGAMPTTIASSMAMANDQRGKYYWPTMRAWISHGNGHV